MVKALTLATYCEREEASVKSLVYVCVCVSTIANTQKPEEIIIDKIEDLGHTSLYSVLYLSLLSIIIFCFNLILCINGCLYTYYIYVYIYLKYILALFMYLYDCFVFIDMLNCM